ncbi:MAG: HmuY family protein [Putridiphycobacter sp.]
MKNNLIIFLVLVIFYSCEKDEIAIPPHQIGDATENQVSMSSDYRFQIYFDLETNTIVKSNLKTEWDLAFECGANGHHIFINTSKSMAIAKSNASFSKTDTLGLNWNWEAPSGNLDSTAFREWTTSDLFFIDLGYDSFGTHQGFGKLQIIDLTSQYWQFNYCYLSETNPFQITLQKEDAYNAVFFSFLNGGSQVDVEPPKNNWDICFTQYTHIFYDLDQTPYLVSGVLINRYLVGGSKIFDLDFSNIDFEDITDYPTTSTRDIIGYNWKFFDFDAEKYTTDPSQNYLLKSTEGYYFKLHFINFYDETGTKGNPKFEFQKL